MNAKYEDTQTSIPPPLPASSSQNPEAGKMVEALSRQMAYLEGDPGQSKFLKVHYVRVSQIFHYVLLT